MDKQKNIICQTEGELNIKGVLSKGQLPYFLAGARKKTLPAGGNYNVLLNVIENAKIAARIEISDLPSINHVMLDSSGFSILTADESNKHITFDQNRPLSLSKTGINIAPLHVVQAACELQPDMMVSLDYPIRRLRTEQEQCMEFKRKLPYNIQWAIETSTLRDKHCPNIPLFLAVQAYSLEDFREFERNIRGLNFDGLSMPIRNLGLQEIALFLFEFYKSGANRVHLLGTSSFLTIGLAAYFSNHYFSWVSFDSRSWRLAAEHSEYMNPLNLRRESLRLENIQDKEHLRRYCPCPVCRKHSLKSIKGYPFAKRTSLLREHNVFATQKVADDLVQNAATLVTLEKFLKSRTSIKVVDELIDALRHESISKPQLNTQPSPILWGNS